MLRLNKNAVLFVSPQSGGESKNLGLAKPSLSFCQKGNKSRTLAQMVSPQPNPPRQGEGARSAALGVSVSYGGQG